MNPNPLQKSLEFILKMGKNPYERKWPKILHSFLEKYDGLFLYDIYINKIYIIDDEDIQFVNKYGYSLIGNPDHPDGTSNSHEYFLIYDVFFTSFEPRTRILVLY